MNNYCRNCGQKLEENIERCPKCNAEIFASRIDVEQKKQDLIEYKRKEKLYIILTIMLYALSYLVQYFGNHSYYSSFSSLLFFAATIILIYARITMNDSKKIKVMFSIFFTIIVIYILWILVMFMACSDVFAGCVGNLKYV